jgi:hypothetical protein
LPNLSGETFLLPDGFFTKPGPQIRLLPVPNFGVNTMFTKEDPKHMKFAFMHCWNILKDKPKWMGRKQDVGCEKNKQQETTDYGQFYSRLSCNTSCCPLLMLLMKVNHL